MVEEPQRLMTTSFVLRGLDANGVEFFYTGKAGSAWVSTNVADAFRYELLEGARRQAVRFNERVSLTDLWFLALER